MIFRAARQSMFVFLLLVTAPRLAVAQDRGAVSGFGASPFAAGDFNADGHRDVAVASQTGRAVRVFQADERGNFAEVAPFLLEDSLLSLAAGDFTGDGKTDIVVGTAGRLILLVSEGNGSFRPATIALDGWTANAVVVGDFDGDGRLDVAVADTARNRVGVWFGDGEGGLRAGGEFGAELGPAALAAGDFNGDGRMDLAVAGSLSHDVSLLVGLGDGTFQPAVRHAVGNTPRALAVGDFNGDGNADLVVANALDRTVSVVLGSARGRFQKAVAYAAGELPWNLMVADVDGDGRQDVAVSSAVDGSAIVLTGNGDGTFQTGRIARNAAGEVRGNGTLGVLFGDRVVVWAGVKEAGAAQLIGATVAFAATPNPAVYGSIVTLTATVSPIEATGKVTFYDGMAVVGVGTLVNGTATVRSGLLAAGSRTLRAYYQGDANFAARSSANVRQTVNAQAANSFRPGVIYSVGSFSRRGYFPVAIAVADFNGDGKPDAATINYGSSDLTVLLGRGDGSFGVAWASPLGPNPLALTTGDFDGDGNADLAVTNFENAAVMIFLGNGDGTFEMRQVNGPFDPNPNAISAGDFNGDGKTDLVVAGPPGNGLNVLLAGGDSLFQAPVNYVVGSNPSSVAVGDFNGDGKADLASANTNSGNVSVLLGNGNGTFQPAVNYVAGPGPISIATEDFNGDGKLDLAVANRDGNSVSVLLGNGNGSFQAPVFFAAGAKPVSLTIADINGDGNADLAVSNSSSSKVSVLLGNGNGTFKDPANYPSGLEPRGLAAGDFNGDGMTDLAVASNGRGGVAILLGSTIPAPVLSSTVTPDSGSGTQQIFTVTLSDSNGNSLIGGGRILFSTGSSSLANSCYVSYDRATSSLALMNDSGTAWSGFVQFGSTGVLQNNQCRIDLETATFQFADGNRVILRLPITFGPAFTGKRSIYVSVAEESTISAGLNIERGSWTVPAAATPAAVSVSPDAGSGSGGLITAVFSDGNGWENLTLVELLVASSVSSGTNCYIGYNPRTNVVATVAATGTLGSSSGVLNGAYCLVDLTASRVVKSGNTVSLTLSVSLLSPLNGAQKIFGKATNRASLTSDWQELGSYTVNSIPSAGGVTPSNGRGLRNSFSFSFRSPNGPGDLKAGEVLFAPSLGGNPICYLYVDIPGQTIYLGNDEGDGFAGSAGPNLTTSVANGQCRVARFDSKIESTDGGALVTVVIGFFGPMLGPQRIFTRTRGADSSGGQISEWQEDGSFTVAIEPVVSSWTPATGVGGFTIPAGSGSIAKFNTVVTDPYRLNKWIQIQFASGPTPGTAPYCYVHYDTAGRKFWLQQGPGPMDFAGPVAAQTFETLLLRNDYCTVNARADDYGGKDFGVTIGLNITFNMTTFGGTKTAFVRVADQLGNDTGFQPYGTWTVPWSLEWK